MRIWLAVVALAFVVSCKRPDAASDAYVNEQMAVPRARMEDAQQILRSMSGSLTDKPTAPPELIHAAKTLHAANAAMSTIAPPAAFKTVHAWYVDLSQQLAESLDKMVSAATAHDSSSFTQWYTMSLKTLQTISSSDARWEELVKEAHVTPKKLPAPPAD